MLDKITAALDSRIFSNRMIMENLTATKNELLRRIGVGVCEGFSSRLLSFLPNTWKFRLFLMTDTGKALSTVIIAQALGHTMYHFKDKLSEENQKYLELMRTAAWSASASALMDVANLDRVFDMIVPDSMKKLLTAGMSELNKLDNKIAEAEANK